MKTPWDAPQAWRFIAALLSSPGLGVLVPTERHAEVAEQIREIPQLTGNFFHDAHTAIWMREYVIRQICTRDTDFLSRSF